MKTTRRNLLRFLGLGAAAAALAPSVGQAAQIECPVCDEPMANDPHLSEHVLARHYVDPSPRLEAIHARNVAQAREYMGTTTLNGAPFRIIKTGELVNPVEVKAVTDAIANARAEGYNRGREVESARWEARQDPSVTPSQMSRGWIYTQTGDGIVVERANA